ncbi:MAG TPA: hypothetical protein VNC12_10450 [Solirubrobacteraceae bacterium]|nr:hypothetical protein [Solirubrobacteraceae bacterium]
MSGPLLLCFDGSETAAQAIRHAAALLPGREAVVLTVAIPLQTNCRSTRSEI